ncbi:MAG: hypothetical protein ACT4PV_03830 [Planctomycetaceae bacterium]
MTYDDHLLSFSPWDGRYGRREQPQHCFDPRLGAGRTLDIRIAVSDLLDASFGERAPDRAACFGGQCGEDETALDAIEGGAGPDRAHRDFTDARGASPSRGSPPDALRGPEEPPPPPCKEIGE